MDSYHFKGHSREVKRKPPRPGIEIEEQISFPMTITTYRPYHPLQLLGPLDHIQFPHKVK